MAELLRIGAPTLPALPLRLRAPTRDADGGPVSDFMVLIPGFKRWPQARQLHCASLLQAVLAACPEVVFADLNMRLSLLWVSVKAEPGSCGRVAAIICEQVPEARLISPNPDHFRR